jgi:hypothetical protein
VFAARFQLGANFPCDLFLRCVQLCTGAATVYCRFLMCTNMLWPVWFHRFSGQSSMSTYFLLQLCLYFYLFFLVCYLKTIVVDWRRNQHAVSHYGRNITQTFLLFFEHMHHEFCLIYMIFCCHHLIQEKIFGVFFYDRKNGDVGDWYKEFLAILSECMQSIFQLHLLQAVKDG